jgi:hypothetical protein
LDSNDNEPFSEDIFLAETIENRSERPELSLLRQDMLRSLSFAASSRILWPTTGNISQISLRTLRKRTRMPFKLITLASCSFIRRQTIASQSCATPKSLPLDVPVDEETIPGYDPKNFYHPDPGDILDHRYKLKAKIGWGTSSTVWIAQDICG